jgi:uncharacterized protein (DUF924 family)
MTPDTILTCWFGENLDSQERVEERCDLWFGGPASFDDFIRARFADLPERAKNGEFEDWRREPRSSLALVLVLDQFPRNLFRGSNQSFAYDGLAEVIAIAAIASGFDTAVHPVEAAFFYLPLEHAEDREAQRRCISLFRALVERAPAALRPRFESFVDYAVSHEQVIDRFGRFPHRNATLGRTSTPEERAFLDGGGETFGGSDALGDAG